MTLWLAIETATDIGSVALGSPGTVLADLTFGDRQHARAVTPSIQELLRLTGKAVDDLQGVIVADGPGSFTGLRIGLASAKGLYHARPTLQFRTASSMLATAWRSRLRASGPIGVWYDALRGEVFSAVFDFRGARVRAVSPPSRVTPSTLIGTVDSPTLVVGDGAISYADQALAWTGTPPVGPPDGAPSAGALLELLGQEGATNVVSHPAAFEPSYGRAAEAQVRWEAEHGRPLPHS